MKRTDTMTRFMAKVNKIDECWVWKAGMTRDGYGRFSFDGQTQLAHRVAYELWVGPIPAGLEVDHLCSNPLCVNPDHLEPVVQRENMRRWSEHKTHCKQGHPFSGENLYVRPSTGWRYCKECNRQSTARYAAKKRNSPVYLEPPT